jgi:hypothetical protein
MSGVWQPCLSIATILILPCLLLQAAIESVTLNATGQSQMNAVALTHLQVVEAAANDAEKQVLEAEQCAPASDHVLPPRSPAR